MFVNARILKKNCYETRREIFLYCFFLYSTTVNRKSFIYSKSVLSDVVSKIDHDLKMPV